MNTNITLTAALAAIACFSASCGEKKKTPAANPSAEHDHSNCTHDHGHADGDGHGHSHAQKIAGPLGGRVLTKISPHAEFFVTKDQKIKITFLNEDNQPIALGVRSAKIQMGKRNAPTTLELSPSADQMSLLSSSSIPEGNMIDTYVTFKMSPDAKPIRESFILNLSECSSCDYLEYACTCDH